ncbi:alpha/beta hydrolase [Dehalogenimonas etheniformans]|uniref:alpha/beta hydrolase n=1 Tax=Dehalogenimonas etheniformans TaxID=1536648 RepID=UPI001D02687A|nr:alpha/beta hydrolase [Dehalogenimonas etheniformans]
MTTVRPEKLGTVDRDVVFGTGGPIALRMDVYYPKAATGPVPAIIYVHGGGWVGGDKNEIPPGYTGELTSRGYLVASINYRLAPTYKFPAPIEDVKCAVRFLRAKATDYGIDPARIGAMGASAGGHLVSLLGVTAGVNQFEGTGGWQDQSSKVKAVVDPYGPEDLNALFAGAPPFATAAIFGGSDSKTLDKYSPVSYVAAGNPPFLIIQGDQDVVVPPAQSQGFYDRLIAAKVPATLVVVKNAGHSFAPAGGAISPSLPEIYKIVADFFDVNLK